MIRKKFEDANGDGEETRIRSDGQIKHRLVPSANAAVVDGVEDGQAMGREEVDESVGSGVGFDVVTEVRVA